MQPALGASIVGHGLPAVAVVLAGLRSSQQSADWTWPMDHDCWVRAAPHLCCLAVCKKKSIVPTMFFQNMFFVSLRCFHQKNVTIFFYFFHLTKKHGSSFIEYAFHLSPNTLSSSHLMFSILTGMMLLSYGYDAFIILTICFSYYC